MLSTYEMEVVTNAELILTKNRIIGKVCDMFGSLSEHYRHTSASSLPSHLLITTPKISKGENYLGLPYVVLDYPRNFGKEAIFAIRTFFWWGNFFSLTLQLSGHHKTTYATKIERAIKANGLNGWYLSCGSTEWDHHFEENNYLPVDTTSVIQPQTWFIKLATRISLREWENAELLLKENYNRLLSILAD